MANTTGLLKTFGDAAAELQSAQRREGLLNVSFEDLRNRAIGRLTPDSALGAFAEPVDGYPDSLRSRPTLLERVEVLERAVVDAVDFMLDHPEAFGA